MHSRSVPWQAALAGLAWLAGVGLHLQQAALPPMWQALVLAAAGALALRWRPVRVLGVGLLAFGLCGAHGAWRLQQSLPGALEQVDLQLEGVVATLPQRLDHGLRFGFDVRGAWADGRPVVVPPRVLLGWYAGFHGRPGPGGPPDDLRAGDVWRLAVRLRRPHALHNPHGPDPELGWFEQGVRALGTVRTSARWPAERVGVSSAYPVSRARQGVRDAVFAAVPDARAAGVLAALAVGDQSAIDRASWQVFRDTGVAHLMSISGLHVTLFAWLAGGLVQRAWRRWPAACLRWPAPAVAPVSGLLAATAYAVLAGWGVPSRRTVWMLAVVVVLRWRGRRWPLPAVLLAAAVVVSAFDPWALVQPGFWLSFAAVGLLAAAARPGPPPDRHPVLASLADAARTQAVATVALTPLSVVLFQQVSVVGFAANLVAIPLVTLGVMPLALVGVLWTPAWTAGAWAVAHASSALGALAAWPAAVWWAAAAPPWVQAAGLAGAALAVLPVPWRCRALGLVLAMPLLAPPVPRPETGRFEVLAADVGQGAAVLVRTRHHVLLYDAGPAYSPEATAGERVLVPLLRARGEPSLDRLVLSHRDTDHVGGAPAVLDAFPVRELLGALEPGHPLWGRAASDRRCDAGDRWTWDGVQFEVLFPPARDHDRPLKPNAKSCVLRISGAQGSVLLAGDIERDQEARLVASATPLRSTVLLVPHHGSRTSSTAAFLDAVAPTVAVIQAGHLNRFGHPVPEVLARLAERRVQVVDSPACGAWHWTGIGPPSTARCSRIDDRRYWRHPGAGDSAKMPP